MTNQNNAAQAIQEAERIAAADEYFKARTWIMDTNDNRRIFEAGFDRAYALLSKRRAPVADERACTQKSFINELGNRITITIEGPTSTSENILTPVEVAQLREALNAHISAPVAGEAKSYPGDDVAARLDNMADDQPPGSQAQSDLYAAATIWRKHIAHRAAPQASEAVRDAERLEFLITHGAWVAWSKDHELCRVFHRDEDGDVEPFLGWRQSARAAAYTARDAIDAAMGAMSAQPGAQSTGGSDAE